VVKVVTSRLFLEGVEKLSGNEETRWVVVVEVMEGRLVVGCYERGES